MNADTTKPESNSSANDSAFLPLGYKRTEVGVIPTDWSVFSIGELFEYLRTASNSRADLGETGVVAYVHYGDIHTRFHHFIDFSRDNVPRLLDGKSVTATRLRDGDLIVADASEDEAGVGKSVEVRNLGETEAVSGLHTFLLRSKDRRVHAGYRGYLLEKESVKRQLRRLATGLKVFGISKRAFRDVRIPLPPPAEQRAIVEVLSDVDGLIWSLDALIAKKRAIKQAVMQQLLTGKTRLPGFSGAWETKRLGEVASIRKGQLITQSSIKPGAVPVVAGGKKPAYFHNCANRTGKTITVSASGAYAGYVAYWDRPIFASDCSTISDAPNYSIEYIFYSMLLRQAQIYRAQTGGAQPHVHRKDLDPLMIAIPPIREQRAIAAILSDMDAEIAALERRRDKTCAIKQGMMQQLLTGRVRLVKSE